MNLLSKNSPLEESIKNMQTVLNKIECFPTFSQEKNPLQNCYSVNLASKEAPNHIYSNGKGILSKASIASAYGEFIERLQTKTFFIDFYLPNRKYFQDEALFELEGEYLNKELRLIYNPNNELEKSDLIDFNSNYTDKILTLPFINQKTKESVYFPLNILSNLYVSNGLATGNTPKEAQVQALSEIVERYVKLEIIKKGYALPKFPKKIVDSFEKVSNDVKKLRELGYIVEVLDASLGGVFPVTAISLINPNNATLFVSFGAHPMLEVALERTMTELMQGRDLTKLDSFEVPTFNMDLVADSFNLESHFIDSNGKMGFPFLSSNKSFEFVSWSYNGKNSNEEYAFLLNILEPFHKDIYIREHSYLGFYSCQIVVPNFSEVYPIEDLVYNNKNSGKQIRHMVLNFKNYPPSDILDAIYPLDNSINVELYIGVIFEEKFSLGEFKAQMLLDAQEYEEAIALLEIIKNPIGKIVAELLRLTLNKHLWEDYEEALESIYGKKALQKAIDTIEGKEFLINTTLHKEYFNIVELFDKVQKKENIA